MAGKNDGYLLELDVSLGFFLRGLGGGRPVLALVEVTHAGDLEDVFQVGVVLHVLGLLQKLDGLGSEGARLNGLEGCAMRSALVACVAG